MLCIFLATLCSLIPEHCYQFYGASLCHRRGKDSPSYYLNKRVSRVYLSNPNYNIFLRIETTYNFRFVETQLKSLFTPGAALVKWF